ncbi:hypothetical protein HUS70_02395 [Pandoraea nosoerga]|uniref:Bestrophin n=1 Tax=Pandoraea nosoerga TaxID=2508296 RepID=A0A5E4T276_9BURK|nr:bestrophin family ion channel [Pandoraea nosoerga]MBN4664378.1 hypothetical protein [Pandoraea nosoerga]MBN4675726.1 hypothetical protein [Pandoraea nosoerga]MBN4679467.1 hypothetical protein [Pandoraea nosoerga]MBN4743536.1 hypothetical protein [Pandoraea nosoerga]VVD81382.1 hypothetical protein PNO31109_01114 [Pandoraea nosoerga]
MIVRPNLHWLRMLFVVRGSILPKIAPQLVFTTIISILVSVAHGRIFEWKIPLTFVPFSLIGITLAIFLGFRNTTSYARYWEARVLWGSVLNETRALARQSMTLIADTADSPRFVAYLIAFVHGMRHQLRGTDARADFERLLSPEDVACLARKRFKPIALLLLAGEWLRERRLEGQIDAPLAQVMEMHLDRMGEAIGGCERIATTPIPFTYGVILHRVTYLYSVLLPFGLVDSIGPMTPVIVAFISYTFFALEAVSAEIEEPFGMEANDLALDAMTETIEQSLREILHRQHTAQVRPHDHHIVT